MALENTTLETIHSEIVEADVWFLSGVHFYRPVDGTNPAIDVEITCGQRQPDTSIDWVFTVRHTIRNERDSNGDIIPGEDWLTQFMTRVTQDGETFKEALLRLCYGYMKQRGLAPATTTDIPEPVD